MSVFNYRTDKDNLQTLGSRITKIEKILKALRFWEVNDVSQGPNVLKRRRVTPSIGMGSVARSNWAEITGLNHIYGGGSGTSSYADYLFGFATPITAIVTVNAGELQDSMLAVKAVATADITVTDVPVYYIYCQYVYGTGNTPTILGSATRPVMDALTARVILHTWKLTAGVATLIKIYHTGCINIWGTFGTP